ncbi:hypothetical protein KCU65_g342, partial [Aureobasidium melanogenum]
MAKGCKIFFLVGVGRYIVIAYDDVQTLGIKVNFAEGQCLGGVMVSAMTHDDWNGTYSYALDKAVGRIVTNHDPDDDSLGGEDRQNNQCITWHG